MSDDRQPVHHAFGEFRVTTESMPDGRQIHYYEWPFEPDDRAVQPADDEADPASDGDE